MKPHELDGHPKHVKVTLFNLARPKAGIVHISLTAHWPEDIHRKVEQKTALPSFQHFMDETSGVFEMQIAERDHH